MIPLLVRGVTGAENAALCAGIMGALYLVCSSSSDSATVSPQCDNPLDQTVRELRCSFVNNFWSIRFMILDLEKMTLPADKRYQVCIVGSGAAGILLGVNLARAKFSVVMLEGGGRSEEARSSDIYTGNAVGRAYPGFTDGRRRVFGGSTTAWGGQILPLTPIDFEKRDWVPGSGWPIDGALLAPFYERALAFEGLGAAIRSDADVWRAIRVDPGKFSPNFDEFFSRWCPEPNFARIYGAEIEAFSNLDLALHANVVRIDTDPLNGHIRSLSCRGYDGVETRVTADRYVFCLGGLETVRLLLQPPEGNAAAPWAASGHVGKHYQDHLGATVGRLKPGGYATIRQIFDNYYRQGIKYHPRIRASREFQREQKILSGVAYFVQQSKQEQQLLAAKRMVRALRQGNLGALVPRDVMSAAGGSIALVQQALRLATKARAHNPDDLGTKVDVSCEQSPLGESRITLSEVRDALGMRRIALDWKIDAAEIETMQKMGKEVAALFKARGWPEIELDPDLMRDPQAFSEKVFDYYHHMSGARMSLSERDGVVDTDLKLHGTPNGYVCSAAVFPTSGFSNPTHTVLALAMRLNDHLAGLVSRGGLSGEMLPQRRQSEAPPVAASSG
jgi:choline dehydrogenase-like flavoprotein